MNEYTLSLTISTLIETVMLNYELMKKRFKEAITKSRLVENVIKIYAQNGLRLTDSQIDTYREFAAIREEANQGFKELINKQECFVTGYMLKDNSNLDLMYEKVNKVKTNQDEMMSLCDKLIEKSNVVLDSF